MNICNNRSILNLSSLFNFLGDNYPLAVKRKGSKFYSIQTKDSAWPSAIYSLSKTFFTDTKIFEEIKNGISNKTFAPLILIFNNEWDFVTSKLNGIYPIDQWVLMGVNIRNLYLSRKNVDEKIVLGKIKETDEIENWLNLVSKTLFSDKRLSKELFLFLWSSGHELIYLKKNDKIIGTSFIYFDEYNVAGIYMVCIASEFRMQGLGNLIMNYCFKCITARKIERIVLQSTKDGINLYKSLGFTQTGVCNLLYKIK